MTENFEQLFEDSVKSLDFKPGSVIKGKVLDINNDWVLIDAGLKAEDFVPVREFQNQQNELEIKVGDEVDLVIEALDNGLGKTPLSREKARRLEVWKELEVAHKENLTVEGLVIERVRGGFTVEINKVRAFLPGSLVDVRPVRDASYIEGKVWGFKLIKMDEKRNNIVVSRRAVIQDESGADKAAVLSNLEEDQVITGVVKNLTDYGAFIDLGGVDGLLHITDISWKRVKHPSEVVQLGDELTVKVLKFDRDKSRVSLGLKQLGEDPWSELKRRHPVGSRVFGKVTNITDYGCFVEIEPGIEGLVHMSEMDWTNKNVHPAKVVAVGQEVEVVVLEIDEEKRRISLGMKQCQVNPWSEFAAGHEINTKITGNIKSITDFGIFIGLDGGIDGLVHLSDISWTEPGEKAVRNYKKGQEVEALILAADADRERISLGIKQLHPDPYAAYLEANPKGATVKAKATEVNAKAAIVDLGDGVLGRIKVNDLSTSKISDATDFLDVGDEVEAKIVGFDKKGRCINLSMRVLQAEKEGKPQGTKLGDILKEQMDKK